MKHIGVEIAAEHGFGRAFLEGVSDYAALKSDACLHSVSQDHLPTTRALARMDGLILRLFGNAFERRIRAARLPTVDIYGAIPRPGIARVHGDYAKIGQMAAEFFLARGYASIAWCGIRGAYFSDRTKAEFADRVRRAGADFFPYDCSPTLARSIDFNAPDRIPDEREIVAWLHTLPKPCAVYCCNDHRAYQVMHLAGVRGFSIPDEIAILGTDNDSTICAFADTPISSIDPDAFRIGRTAARVLDALMSEPAADRHHRSILIPPKCLIERQSTQHIPVSPRWLSRALLSIHQNLAAGISAGDVVRLSGFSAPVVERVFEERFGMSVIGYLTEERMKLAKKLLKTTDLQAKAVAAACGYASQQYFCRVFRTRYGQSPRQIR